jgi:GAF domain-containing protein
MSTTRADVSVALTEAARTLNAHRSVDETLDSIVAATLESVPGFNHVGVSVVHRDGTIETRSATDQFVWENDSLQYDLQEGPCFDTLRGSPVVAAPRIRQDQRWPNYVPRAVTSGLRAQLALRLYVDQDTLGGLNLYSTETEDFSPDAVHLAELFATHAAIALGHARDKEQLSEAIATRQTIGQAVGIVMERYGIDSERAFQFLVRASSTSNIKLRLIAEELVEQADERRRAP